MNSIEVLLNNDAFIDEILAATDSENFVKMLNQYGVVLEDGMSAEDAFQLFKSSIPADELSEESLDDVAGGGLGMAAGLIYCSPYVPGVGWIVGAVAVGALAAYAYYKKRKK